jgi:catechol 2,3-dioxygenase-like lactoylglutathione lyase family enzyme
MPANVSPLVHIEIVVRDVNVAAAFLEKVFGAQRTEQDIVRFLNEISLGLTKVEHVQLGNVVLQFIEPLPEGGDVWAEHLRKKGPGVHNLTFQVDNVLETASTLAREGAPTLFTLPLDWVKLLGPDNVRENVPPVHMVGSEEIVGFRLELYENPSKVLE